MVLEFVVTIAIGLFDTRICRKKKKFWWKINRKKNKKKNSLKKKALKCFGRKLLLQ